MEMEMNVLYVNSLEANNKELARQLASCQAALADTEALEVGTGERLAKVEKQLAAALAACKLKDDALELAMNVIESSAIVNQLDKALAIQPDDSALKAWLGEPIAWTHSCPVLCLDDVELWINKCPHCGKPAPKGLK